ncbi:MAG: hypothetical protein RMN25_03055 [Anaerolineae bacterium]|nr:hypothetical protein [Thermoflexales bacterium]MDW8406736.1 hypothetical protein [Anaerolineae bacterium]
MAINQSFLVLGVLTLVIVVTTIAVVLIVARAQQRLMRRSFRVQLTNDGNIAGRYEVWAECSAGFADPSNIVFEFWLDDVLVACSVENTAPKRTTSYAHAGLHLTANQSSPVAAIQHAAQQLERTASQMSDVADAAAPLLPPVIVTLLRRLGMQMRAAQSAVTRTERNTARYRRLASSAVQTVSNTTAADSSRSVGQRSSNLRPGVAQTPLLEPGQSTVLKLVAKPARIRAAPAQPVQFNVCSRSLHQPDSSITQIQAEAHFKSVSGFRFYLPFVLTFIAAAVLMALLWANVRVP